MPERRNHERGMSLAEVMVAIGIVAVLIFATMTATSTALTQTKLNQDREFAAQKAMSILEELKALVQSSTGSNVVVLDSYDDGAVYKTLLTTQTVATAPPLDSGDPVSGNINRGTATAPDWVYSRQVSVTRLPGLNSVGVRMVRVSVFKNDPTGPRLLAEVASVIRTLSGTLPQTQVYDVYTIAIENVPGWWVNMANLVPTIQNAIEDMQTRNPGLEYRVHWITKLSYGRDQQYRPFINSVQDADHDIPWAYFYPGTLTSDTSRNPIGLSAYYPPAQFQAHMLEDTTPADNNGYDATNNPFPYALADQYNNGMRYQDEYNLFQKRLAFGGEDKNSPTYRLLLDDMYMNPQKYTNAILINLHGELFPFPPVRNYSDAAKDPVTFPKVRVVTHPEQLTYDCIDGGAKVTGYSTCTTASTAALRLRVYSYKAPAAAVTNTSAGWLGVPITVRIRGMNIPSANMTITAVQGGTAQISSTNLDNYTEVSPAPSTASGNRMYATVTYDAIDNDTVVRLYNSPLQSPCASNSSPTADADSSCSGEGGLQTQYRLYSMEYIPAPMEDFTSTTTAVTGFTAANNLDGTGNKPKNTARWIISIPASSLPASAQNAEIAIETKIGDDFTTPCNEPLATEPIGFATGATPCMGTLYPTASKNKPANISRTYVWRGTDTWLYGDGTTTNTPHLPITEQYQYIGDPRHEPYVEMKRPHVDSTTAPTIGHGNEHRLGMGYDRYWDDFANSVSATAPLATYPAADYASTWPGWSYTIGGIQYGIKADGASGNDDNDGWMPGNGQIEVDMSRIYQTLRNVYTSTRSVYTTMTGYSYYYMGMGDEIGYDAANGFPNSVPVSTMPFTNASGTGTEQTILNDATTGVPNGVGVKYIRDARTSGSFWWGMTWLGELYPDAQYASQWDVNGNLSSNGTGTSKFKRVLRAAVTPPVAATQLSQFQPPPGTTFEGNGGAGTDNSQNATRRTMTRGSPSLYWTGTSTSTFHHTPGTYSGSLVLQGLDMAATTSGYNYPLLTPISEDRPFNLNVNSTGDNPTDFLAPVYGSIMTTKVEGTFYQPDSTHLGSALVSVLDPATKNPAFIVVNGLSPVGTDGTNYIGRWAFLTLIHSYFLGGLYTDSTSCTGCPKRIPQLPRVSITFPSLTDDLTDVTDINIQWSVAWKRYDGQKYTPAYSSTFSESTPLTYYVMYSPDNGVTWKYVQDGSTASLGQPPAGAPSVTTTSYDWSVSPGSFPSGNYLIRVEAYRNGFPQHYSYHEFRAFIRRTS